MTDAGYDPHLDITDGDDPDEGFGSDAATWPPPPEPDPDARRASYRERWSSALLMAAGDRGSHELHASVLALGALSEAVLAIGDEIRAMHECIGPVLHALAEREHPADDPPVPNTDTAT